MEQTLFTRSIIATQIFNWAHQSSNTGNTWVGNVKQIFQALNLMSNFENKQKVNIDCCEEKFHRIMQENWSLNVPLKPK